MTILQKISNKLETYTGRGKTYFYRAIDKLYPQYYDLKKMNDRIFPLGFFLPGVSTATGSEQV